MIEFDRVVDMKTAPIPGDRYAILGGYNAVGDGGGGLFHWDPKATEPDDTGMIFQRARRVGAVLVPEDGVGRWKRLWDGAGLDRAPPAELHREPVWPYVRAEWFGARGDGVTDDAPALQRALDTFFLPINSTNGYARGGTLRLSPGRSYRITRPLLLSGDAHGRPTPQGITIEGERKPYQNGEGPDIIADYLDRPAIIVSIGRSIAFRNFKLSGKNDYSARLAVGDPLDDATYQIADPALATDRYSPYAGIAFDPFDAKVPEESRYPGFDSYYVGGGSGTQIVTIEHLTIAGFFVGVMLNCSKVNAQGDTFVIEQCVFVYDTYCVAIGQSQSRAVHLRDNQYSLCRTLLTTLRFGFGAGAPPYVEGGQAASIKYLFELQTDAQGFNCDRLYGEEIHSLGWLTPNPHIGANPVAFRGCTFSFSQLGANERRVDCLGWLRAPTRFESCSLQARTFDFFVTRSADLVFESCVLFSSWARGDNLISTDYPANIVFRGCMRVDPESLAPGFGHLAPLSNPLRVSPDFDTQPFSANRQIVMPGTLIQQGEVTYQVELYRAPRFGVALAALGHGGTVSFDAQGATLTLQPGAEQLVKPGDIVQWNGFLFVYERPAGARMGENGDRSGLVGRVESVVGQIATLRDVPRSLQPGTTGVTDIEGTYLVVTWLRRFHEPTIGDVVESTRTIENVSAPEAWASGDRISSGDALWEGTYIVEVDVAARRFTLSAPARQTGTGLSLYDAKAVRSTPSP